MLIRTERVVPKTRKSANIAGLLFVREAREKRITSPCKHLYAYENESK